MSHTKNPLAGWKIEPNSVEWVGRNLSRLECIIAQRDGTLIVADPRSSITKISQSGEQTLLPSLKEIQQKEPSQVGKSMPTGKVPNGIALGAEGNIFIADIGVGTIDKLSPNGILQTLFSEIDGRPLGKANYVMIDSKGRLWVTVSTRLDPWSAAMRPDVGDGFIALVEDGRLRIVADDIAFANEVKFDAKEEWLYVVETARKRVSRFKVDQKGDLNSREIYGPASLGIGFPDGIAFDSYGNLWCTMIFADRVIAITPDQEVLELLNEGNPVGNKAMEDEYAQGRGLSESDMTGGKIAPWTTSVTFGGPDLKTVYLGSLKGTQLPAFRSPVAGLAMSHW